MSFNTVNKLCIYCANEDIIEYIERMIFEKDNDGKLVFSLNKLMPIPESLDSYSDFTDLKDYWCQSVWGTSSDVEVSNISVDLFQIDIEYITPDYPNSKWITTLCEMLQSMMDIKYCDCCELIVVHDYYNSELEFAGKLDWICDDPIEYKQIPLRLG